MASEVTSLKRRLQELCIIFQSLSLNHRDHKDKCPQRIQIKQGQKGPHEHREIINKLCYQQSWEKTGVFLIRTVTQNEKEVSFGIPQCSEVFWWDTGQSNSPFHITTSFWTTWGCVFFFTLPLHWSLSYQGRQMLKPFEHNSIFNRRFSAFWVLLLPIHRISCGSCGV